MVVPSKSCASIGKWNTTGKDPMLHSRFRIQDGKACRGLGAQPSPRKHRLVREAISSRPREQRVRTNYLLKGAPSPDYGR